MFGIERHAVAPEKVPWPIRSPAFLALPISGHGLIHTGSLQFNARLRVMAADAATSPLRSGDLHCDFAAQSGHPLFHPPGSADALQFVRNRIKYSLAAIA